MAPAASLALLALAILGSVHCQFERERVPDARRDQTDEACFEKVMDIFFVLDSSTSIYVNDFKQERQFVRDVVARLDVNPRSTRVGVLTFSDDIERPTLGLNQNPQKSDVLASVNEQNLPYRTGITNTDQAIRYVRENTEFRQDITKVIVVVTDGGSRSPGATAREAEMAREAGFYLFVVGVGQYLDEREWRAIASDPDDSFIYNITNFRYLDSVKYSLPPRACALPPIIVGGYCGVQQPADLYFVAAPGGTQDAIQLIDNFIERSDDESDSLRISYIIDVCQNAENVPLEDVGNFCDRFSLVEEADVDTYSGLLARMRALSRRNQANREAKQVAVLFVDDESMRLNRFGIVNEARNAEQYDGIELVVVDLGVRGFSNFVQSMAANRNNVVRFLSGSLNAQRTVQKMLLDRSCEAINRFDFSPDPNK
ncbi:cartilage matrix protein isoform X2 [Aplysia californica]|uniref:Cartilage matrix protein isoform X2 n=1 Tax=Aplysia californica TaxID=6500 RepID=A0ABM0JW89_APLCA|nr:cartilage matrix protein isoform X2 [Aplysia californica]